MTVEAIHVFNAYIFECCNDSNYIDIYIDIIHIYIVFFHPVHGPHCDSLRPWVLASDHFRPCVQASLRDSVGEGCSTSGISVGELGNGGDCCCCTHRGGGLMQMLSQPVAVG